MKWLIFVKVIPQKKNRLMLNGKLIKDYYFVIALGSNSRLWNLIPMTVIWIRIGA